MHIEYKYMTYWLSLSMYNIQYYRKFIFYINVNFLFIKESSGS